MAGELVNRWSLTDLLRSTSIGYEAGLNIGDTPSQKARGLSFTKNKNAGFQDVIKIPGNATLTSGIKFDLVCVDDGQDSTDLGKVAVFGVTVKLLASGTDNLDITSDGGTEVTANLTLASTSGVVTVLTISVPNASLDSAAAGGTILIRIRRVGDNASDTCNGRVLVANISAYAY